MPITGRTRVFLVLGDPVAQVRAPEVCNRLFADHGVDAVLVPAHVPAGLLSGFVRPVLTARNIDGLWLTIPHKSAMLPLLDRCDALGRVAGAVNAVRRTADGALEGALFDGIGFVRALDHVGIPLAGRRVLLVGIGGAGLAIAASVAQRGVGELALFDTQAQRAEAAAATLRAAFPVAASAMSGLAPEGFDLVVNCTPLGLRPDEPLPFDPARLDAGAAVVDILMTREPTPLQRACEARGIVAHPGFEMLLQQIPEYLAFFGFDTIARSVAAASPELRALLQRSADDTLSPTNDPWRQA